MFDFDVLIFGSLSSLSLALSLSLSSAGIDAEYQPVKDYDMLVRGATDPACVVGGGLRVVITSDRRLVNTRLMAGVPWIWVSAKDPKAQVAQEAPNFIY